MLNLINIANAQIVQCGGLNQPDCGKEQLFVLFNTLVEFGLSIVVFLVAIAIVFGGFLILTSAGNPEKVSRGRKAITSAIVGAVIVFSAWLIVNTLITIFTDCYGQWNVFGDFRCD